MVSLQTTLEQKFKQITARPKGRGKGWQLMAKRMGEKLRVNLKDRRVSSNWYRMFYGNTDADLNAAFSFCADSNHPCLEKLFYWKLAQIKKQRNGRR